MNIVVIEDTLKYQDIIKNIIRKVLFACDQDAKIDMFVKYDKDLRRIIDDTSSKKVYIVDIELANSISGIKIAQIIRDTDWESDIIFITTHDNMYEQAYRSLYKVFNFIEKFHNFEKRLEKDLKIILSRDYDTSMFKFKNRKITLQLYYKDITHITREKEERKLFIHTSTNTFALSMTMSEMIKKLDARFKMVHRACIVNTNRVLKYEWAKGSFLLDTNERVYLLSKNYRDEVEK